MSDGLPDGYDLVVGAGVRGFAWSAAKTWMAETLAQGLTLDAWAGGTGGIALEGGRGGARARPAPVPGPDETPDWVCRHYRRGGWAGPLVGDRYATWREGRPFRELAVSAAARARGVRTPAVVAGAVYRSGIVCRCDIVVERVPEVRSLGAWLLAADDESLLAGLLHRAGKAIGDLERARVLHADASVGNFLLAAEGAPWVIDLDRGRVLPMQAAAPVGPMRMRLERSIRKLCANRHLALSAESWAALRTGYEDPA